ncbi:MAG TPA: carboxypeptidase-like regulatory domain-containing protein, partial [Gemmatimonadaceae bacterium]|nr:carboxypeptidase-like regulatory domain-containing protein [Gemmatimonadaceae bacterium]
MATTTTLPRFERLAPRISAIAMCTCAVMLSRVAAAQSPTDLRVRLESNGGAPVIGALVALLDPRDNVVMEGLTTERGTRTLRAPAGTYRIRVRRIGYLPFISTPVTLPRNDDLLLQVESPKVVLQNIVVTSNSKCYRDDPGARALSVVWDEIEKALRSSQITSADLVGIGRAEVFRRVRSLNGAEISNDTKSFTIGTRRPFAAIAPERLAADGYVIGNEAAGWQFYAPDETVMLSDQFAETHCFRLVRDDAHHGLIGVAFEPAPGRHLADITGALWVDEVTSELREIVFRFVNAGALSRFDAGGFTHFARLPSGAWIVDDWILRAPLLAREQADAYASHL